MYHASPLLISLLFQLVKAQSPLPGFNIFPMRNLVVTGLFDGLTFLPEKYQPPISSLTHISSGIYAQHNGTIKLLGKVNSMGWVKAFCTLKVGDQYFLYVGGSFSQINDHKLLNAAVFDLQENMWSSVGEGLDEVLSIACDNQRQSVLFGSSFQASTNSRSQTGGIFDWNHATSKWNPLSFKGVNGPVNSIAFRPNHNVIIGGQFSSTLDGALSSSPFTNQIDLRIADINVFATLDGKTDHPDRLLCDSDQPFTMLDGNVGDIKFKFPPKTVPSGIRIWNTGSGDGVEKIRIYSLPGPKPIKVSKMTPSGLRECGTEDCWVYDIPDVQEFIFEDTDLGLTEFMIKIVSFHGKRVSIKKLEVFSYTSYAPAYPTRQNLEYCKSYQPRGPEVLPTLAEQPSDSTNLPATLVKKLSYRPNLSEPGYYKISMHKSAICSSLSCHDISLVDIKISPSFTELGEVSDPIIKKKSISDPLTEIYYGYFVKSDQIPTEITVSYSYPKGNAKSLDPILGIIVEKALAQNNLPNLLEFVPSTSQISQGGVVNSFSQVRQPAMEVTALVADKDRLFIGGSLKGVPQVAQVDSNYNVILKGDRGSVAGLAVANQTLYAGGSFEIYRSDASAFLKYLVQLDLTERSDWVEVPNAATEHPVTSFYQHAGSAHIMMTGQFKANRDLSIREPQLHYIDYSPQFKNVSSSAFIDGDISSIVHQPAAEPWTFFTGKIRKFEYFRTTNVAYLSENGSAVPIAATQDSKYNSVMQTAALNTGLIYVPRLATSNEQEMIAHSPLVVVGGKHTQDKFPGVGIYDGNRWQLLNVGSGEVKTLACSDNELFIGGDFDGGASKQQLLVYSFRTKGFVHVPAPIYHVPFNHVNKMIRQYGTTKMIVSGKFDAPTGSSDCNHLCLMDADLKSWSSLAKPLPAEIQEVVDVVSFDNRIVLSSIKMNPDNDLHVYDVSAQSWSKVALGLPGFPSYLSYDNATRGLFVAGKSTDNQSSFIYWWNEVNTHNLGKKLAKSPRIQQIMVVEKPLTAYDDHNLDFKLPPMGALLVSGELMLEGFGPCSGALFNGSVWKPYFTSSRIEKGEIVPGQASVFKMMPFYPRQREYLSTLFIILISLGIALGVLMFIIGLGLFLLFFQHKRRQRSRQALVPLLSDIGSVGPATAITSPLASPINPHPIILNGNEIVQDPTPIPMQERNPVARTSSNIFPDSA